MIQVSNEFKSAIKKPERKIKGYVEVVYDVKEPNITYYDYFPSSTTFITKTVDGKRVENLYGSLDYLPLDGSILTMQPRLNQDSGYISDTVFEEIETPILKYTFDSETINGLTLYFRTNIPTNLTINYSDGTSDTITNDRETIQIIFNEPKTLTYVEIIFNEMMYPDRKIYVNEIDFGLSQVYKDQDLIEFTVDEEVNKLVEEVPINETNIILNNMNNLFNPLNPKGIVPYLSEETLIKPYIGVLTENVGIEYVKMGEFYFDNYTNNSDATTTLVAKNVIKELQEGDVINGLAQTSSAFIDGVNAQTNNTSQGIFGNSDYNVDIQFEDLTRYTIQWINSLYATDFMKDFTMHNFGIMYGNRNNIIIFRNPISNVVETLTKSELINDAEFVSIKKINTLIRKTRKKVSSATYNTSQSSVDMFSETVTLKTSPELFAIRKTYGAEIRNSSLFNFTYTGATSATIKCETAEYAIIEVSGTVGSSVTLKAVSVNAQVFSGETTEERKISKKTDSEKEVILEIESALNNFPTTFSQTNGQLDYAPSYEMRFEYNGDPSLEAGDYISIETPYGYKPLFIQKNRFKFDGGLEGSIEGVE